MEKNKEIKKAMVISYQEFFDLISHISEYSLSLPPVFSMSKLPQKHVANQWDNSWDMLEAKNIKF